MVVDYYGYTSPWFRWIFDETTIHPNKKVGVIDCWNLPVGKQWAGHAQPDYNEQKLRKFLEDKDVSFLLIEEVLDDKQMIDVLETSTIIPIKMVLLIITPTNKHSIFSG